MKKRSNKPRILDLSRRKAMNAGLIMALLVAAAVSAPDSSLAKRKSCTDCHKDIKNLIKSAKAHKPAKKNCETCHKRHGFAQKLVLVKSTPELCLDCHKDVKKEIGEENVHPALSQGGCTVCHDPHASKEKALLRKQQGSPSICVLCHKNHEEKLKLKSAHPPYLKKDCSICHSPHSSKEKHLLAGNEKKLCYECHQDVKEKHSFPSMAKLECSDCHDPHTASKKESLIPTAHAPFSSGECEACHDVSGGEVKLPFEAKEGLCADCHDEESRLVAGDEAHFKESELKGAGACLSCHEPHKSKQTALKKADDDELCRSCHKDLPDRTKYKGSMHSPFSTGKCTECHLPHGGGGKYHLAEESGKLCSKCHKNKFREVKDGELRHEALDARDCLDCHKGHVSDDAPLLSASPKEICLSCHDKEQHKNYHPPYQTAECTACHTNHSESKNLLSTDVNIICGKCHTRELLLARADVPHPPAKDDYCTSCHKPHGGEDSNLLSSSQKELCSTCHDFNDLVIRSKDTSGEVSLHKPVEEGECGRCHDPHGSGNEKLLKRRDEKLCYGCHTKEKVDFGEGNVHDPVKKAKCEACHTPHGSDASSLTRESQPGLCLKCHDFSKEPLAGAHGDFEVTEGKCTACHDPHTSIKGKLLKQFEHGPFAEKSCDACHEKGETTEKLSPATSLGLPDSGKELCMSCHDEKESEKGHQHEKGVDCTDCHNPHSADNSSLLKDKGRVCLKCHEKVLNPPFLEPSQRYVHKAMENGDCLQCHSMHKAAGKKLLTKKQDELCASCHQSVKDRSDDLTMHSPFKNGKCSSCHATHVSAEEHLLKKEEKKLCRTCHSFNSKKMAAAHKGIKLKGEGCTTCHDPHSTQEADSKLIPPTRHAPMAEGDCDVCHEPMKDSGASNALCLDCHDEGDETFANVHPGRESSSDDKDAFSCLACHSPHAGYESMLKRKDQENTCLQCHTREQFDRKNVHGAVEEGCSVCHDLHNSNAKVLKSADVMQLCIDCHEDASQHVHPLGPDFEDPRTGKALTCTSCHEPHSSDYDFLLSFDYRRNLCVQCHAAGTMRVH